MSTNQAHAMATQTGQQSGPTADTATDYRTSTSSPGGLRGEAQLLIQTRKAQILVRGRAPAKDRPGIPGLVRFGLIARRMWIASSLDDPYADWYLIKVLEALDDGREELQAMQGKVAKILEGVRGVELTIGESDSPIQVPLRFANPYGYMGAYLIADYDELARTVLTAKHVGLMVRDDAERMLALGGRLVRRVFSATQGWKYLSVTRDDMAANNARARKAIETMGEIPDKAVLEGTLRPRIAPDVRKHGEDNSDDSDDIFGLLRAAGAQAAPADGRDED